MVFEPNGDLGGHRNTEFVLKHLALAVPMQESSGVEVTWPLTYVVRAPRILISVSNVLHPPQGSPKVKSADPAAMAMYCFPSTANDIGDEYTEEPH